MSISIAADITWQNVRYSLLRTHDLKLAELGVKSAVLATTGASDNGRRL